MKSWDKYFMDITEKVAEDRPTCDRLHVGALLVKDNRIVATGYNGSISGHSHCDDIGHLIYENGCKRTIHAEMNAILQCAREGIPTKDTTIYVTHYPCPDCMKHLNQSGVKRVVYKEYYPHRYENNFDNGMTVERVQS